MPQGKTRLLAYTYVLRRTIAQTHDTALAVNIIPVWSLISFQNVSCIRVIAIGTHGGLKNLVLEVSPYVFRPHGWFRLLCSPEKSAGWKLPRRWVGSTSAPNRLSIVDRTGLGVRGVQRSPPPTPRCPEMMDDGHRRRSIRG